jgi:hypothetical protein
MASVTLPCLQSAQQTSSAAHLITKELAGLSLTYARQHKTLQLWSHHLLNLLPLLLPLRPPLLLPLSCLGCSRHNAQQPASNQSGDCSASVASATAGPAILLLLLPLPLSQQHTIPVA